MERFDLTALINGVLSGMRLLIDEKEASVIFRNTEPVYVWGDEFKIEEVVTNYLTNALNHLDGEKIIEIRLAEENGIVTATVFNTGEPIPTESLDRIWDKFYKVDKARTRAYGGSGIGLSIVKAIMDSHNQTCSVKNYENGVAFSFTLEAK
jgi:signal transduction histidine kinase